MKNKIPYFIVGLMLLLFVLGELLLPKPLDWKITLSKQDKIPYGAYGLWQALPSLFPQKEIRNANLTLYEADTLPDYWNYLILADGFNPDDQDLKVLMNKASNGANVFIAAQRFGSKFADTLHIGTRNLMFESMRDGKFEGLDSVYLSLMHPSLSGKKFGYTLSGIPAYFDSLPPDADILAINHFDKPVLISKKWGKGTFILSCTPLAFSNYYLLEGRNHQFIESALSHLPVEPLFWTEWYQLGRMEATTPLRFVLSQPSLRWAYYVGIITLLLFILFGIKRQQRAIPTLNPPENTSLQFAASIGTLYFQQGDHLNLARKKVIFFNEQVRTHYQLLPEWSNEDFIKQLAHKTGRTEEEVRTIQSEIRLTQTSTNYNSQQLLKLHKTIQSFYRK